MDVILHPSANDEAVSGANSLNFTSTVVIEDVLGGAGSDSISGNDVNNRLLGNGGADFLGGGDGNDALIGDGGADLLDGSAGDDDIFAQDGEADEIRCGPSNDVAFYDPPPAAGGQSPDTFLDDSCETIDDTVN